MLLTDHQINLLQAPYSSIWVGYFSADAGIDIVRLSGALIAEDKQHIDLLVPQRFTNNFLQNVRKSPALSFLCSSILTFEAFQVKGPYLNHRFSTPEEVSYQKEYMQGFSQHVTSLGVKAGYGFTSYFSAPAITIRMKAEEVYDQTPKSGAGKKIS